jgi:hypothetical protein
VFRFSCQQSAPASCTCFLSPVYGVPRTFISCEGISYWVFNYLCSSMYNLSIRHKLVTWLYFGILLIVCLFIYKDFGLSWDETTQRNIGYHAFRYMFEGNNFYLNFPDNVYGVGYELPLVMMEKLIGLEDPREIYHFRHLVNIGLFCLACFVFFRMNLKLFTYLKVAIFPTLLLILTPRIFGHAFFNSKDIPFLCMYIFCFHAFHNYLLKPQFKQLALLSVLGGLLINFRIMGILFSSAVIAIMIFHLLREKKKKQLWHLGFYILVAASCLFATWPYLWTDPLQHLQNAFHAMSKFRWQGTYLLNGVVYHEGENIRNYLFRWIGITVPVVYLIMGLIGIVVFIGRTAIKPKKILDTPYKIMGWVFLGHMIVPIAAVLYFKSVLYDDWRQLYFIYPAFLFFCGAFLLLFFEHFYKWFRRMAFLLIAYLGFVLVQMVILHPYEHVYFNELVPHRKNFLQEHYDQDYWGTSFYDGLKYILKNDTSSQINVFYQQDAAQRNIWMLPKNDRKKIRMISNPDYMYQCPYYMTNFRFDYADTTGRNNYKEIVYEIKRQNSVILRIWKK